MPCPKPMTMMTMAVAGLFAAMLSVAVTRPVIVEASPQATPPAAQQAPATLPAGHAGTEVCATCHTGYDTSINASKHGQAKNPRTPAAAAGCESCHGPGEAHASDPEKIKNAADRILAGKWKKGALPEGWDGKASERIVREIERFLSAT